MAPYPYSRWRIYAIAAVVPLILVLVWMASLWGVQSLRTMNAHNRFASLPTAVICNLLEEQPHARRYAWLEETANQLGVGLSVVPFDAVSLNPWDKLFLKWSNFAADNGNNDFSLYRVIDSNQHVLVVHSVPTTMEFSKQIMVLLRQWIDEVPPAARQARFERLASLSQLNMSIGNGTPYGLRRSQMIRLAQGTPEMVAEASGNVSFYVMLDDYRWVKVGPYSFQHPLPMSAVYLSGLLLCLLEILIVWYFIRRDRAQINWLQCRAAHLSQGNFEQFSLKPLRGRYVVLGQSINQLAMHLQSSVNSQQELIRAVSHEFRTPVARVRFALQMISDVTESEMTKRQLKDVDHDIEVLDRLIDQILTYARVDSAVDGGVRGAGEPIDLAAPAQEVINQLMPLYPDISIDLAVHDDARVQGDIYLLRRAIHNLVENAVQHARERVEITLSQHGEDIRLRVDDDGEGVPTAERQRIFKPFTRIDASRSRSIENGARSAGFGIGLAIVERIAHWHQGWVGVSGSTTLKGACFEMSIPKTEQVDNGSHRQIARPDKTRFY